MDDHVFEADERSVEDLKELIGMSSALGFWDDVKHWHEELKKKQK